jgi:hypothetical protein
MRAGNGRFLKTRSTRGWPSDPGWHGKILFASLQCYHRKLFIFGKILSGQFCQLVHVSFAGGQERGNGGSSFLGDNVSVSAADFGDQAVRSQEPKSASDPTHSAFEFAVIAPAGKIGLANISAAKTVEGKSSLSLRAFALNSSSFPTETQKSH